MKQQPSEKRPFREESVKPTPEVLLNSLKSSHVYFEQLMKITRSLARGWNFSKSGGWMLKIHDRKKALAYLIPLERSFILSLTIREKERSSLLGDDEMYGVHEEIQSAKKYVEGYAMRFAIADKASSDAVITLLRKIMALRKLTTR